jgi:hypothetical protein
MAPRKPDIPPNRTAANMKTMCAEGYDWMPHAFRLYQDAHRRKDIFGGASDLVIMRLRSMPLFLVTRHRQSPVPKQRASIAYYEIVECQTIHCCWRPGNINQ